PAHGAVVAVVAARVRHQDSQQPCFPSAGPEATNVERAERAGLPRVAEPGRGWRPLPVVLGQGDQGVELSLQVGHVQHRASSGLGPALEYPNKTRSTREAESPPWTRTF